MLVLGCTHYPLLKPLLTHVMGQNVRLIDSALETARELARVLEGGLAAPTGNQPFHRWVATDDVARFASVGSIFVGQAPAAVELVSLKEHREVS